METPTSIKNLHEHIASLAKAQPKKTALLSCDGEGAILEEITYKALLEKIDAAAVYLTGLGLTKGDRVALAFGNSTELLIISWAAWVTGIVTVPMDTKRDTSEQYQYKIALNKAKLLIAQRGVLKNIDAASLRGVTVKEFSGFPEYQGENIEWESGLSHLALILFTSGTTAHPKGAKLTLANLLVNANGIRGWLKITKDDCFLVNLPLHHINSTTFCLSVLLAGGTVAVPSAYSNSRFWEQIAKTGTTITSIVQSILFDQLSREEEHATFAQSIKLNRIQIGSAPVVAQTVEEFRKKFNIPLYQGYGQTETALRVTGVPMDLPEPLYEELVEKNSIGVAMPWADLQIADDNGRILVEGEEGELIVKGPAVMEGYLGDEPAFRDGYFLTGDIGLYRIIQGQRYFFLKGRKREMIIKGGINISPVAVENKLKKISDDIAQVYVIAVPDRRYGEEVAAVVCWRDGIDEVGALRRLKYTLLSGTAVLSAYETPKYIASMRADALPTTSTGKVQRTILKTKVPFEQFESIYSLFKTEFHTFGMLHPQSPHLAASHALYNHCWAPLTMSEEEYKRNVAKQSILVAVDNTGAVAGHIAFIRTNLGEKELLTTTYDDLLTPRVLNQNGKAFLCVSICSADYTPKPVPSVMQIPDKDAVRAYLETGHDPVFRFHQKPKGGLAEGAALVDVIPSGRLKDGSSLGYTMLLKYPAPAGMTGITDDAPVSSQLIEAVLLLAKDIGVTDVYAYSRPGGLAAYMAKQE